ncbi:SAM-dependent methyltransferase [Pararhodospirillum oryzae]|uniref:SAM-dependent methyltransferase n=1 Tax=Pararhodospirillum oryzae TaxID=478448 RepID=A0A512H9J8_9PROT|nr:SAM-dependent methyltransferase [Pararhodospirillum oryzae]GEO82112.1 hypothetical protein ROR02_22430 [Pararhodospirillum oryzae]
MDVDFLDAHSRHLKDAGILFEAGRWANADHLFGMAAECGLKRLMVAFGMAVKESGDPEKYEDRKHADAVWVRYETYRAGYGAAEYGFEGGNPFSNWRAEQRYASEAGFTPARVEGHKDAARRVHALVRKAQWEGLLR